MSIERRVAIFNNQSILAVSILAGFGSMEQTPLLFPFSELVFPPSELLFPFCELMFPRSKLSPFPAFERHLDRMNKIHRMIETDSNASPMDAPIL